MSGKPDDDLPDVPAKPDDEDAVLDLGIAEIMAALSVEALMEEALEKALAQEKAEDASRTLSAAPVKDEADVRVDEGEDAASHEDVLQAGPAGDEVEDEAPVEPDPTEQATDDGDRVRIAERTADDTVETIEETEYWATEDRDFAERGEPLSDDLAPSALSGSDEPEQGEWAPELEPHMAESADRHAGVPAHAPPEDAPPEALADADEPATGVPDDADESPSQPRHETEDKGSVAQDEIERLPLAASEEGDEADEDVATENDPAEATAQSAEPEAEPVPPASDVSERHEEQAGEPHEGIDAPAPAAAMPHPRRASRAVPEGVTEADLRFMAAAIRLSRRHLGLTSTNPSVGTLIVKDGRIVGRGVTALGGRPHAETQALAEAGEAARGATAYVTLEPCAHHGRTPPCAEALVAAGIARVIGAAADPDDRVSGKGYAILRAGGIDVIEGVLAEDAADLMAGYLSRSAKKRPEVTLKLALSADNMIGRQGIGQVQITGGIARTQVHMMRAESDAILVGIGTVESDNPELNVRLPGLEDRSPVRIVLDREARLPMMSKLALSARSLPLYVAVGPEASAVRKSSLEMLGVRFLATETHDGRIALPELLEDLAGKGITSVLVEGGAATATTFLEDDMVDRIVLFRSPNSIGADGIASPLTPDTVPAAFRLVREARFGVDQYWEWTRD